MVTELPAPVEAVSKGFTAEGFKAKGMKLIKEENLDFKYGKARIVQISQPANGVVYLKQILVFGDSSKTVIVNGIYPELSQTNEVEMREAILSVSYNEGQDDNPLDAVNFQIDLLGANLKLAKYLAGSLIYTADGKIPSTGPMFIAGSSISNKAITDQKQFSIYRLKNLPEGASTEVVEISEIEIDNLSGYAITGHNTAKNTTVYQVILFTNADGYFILVGTTNENREENLALFKKVARTFRRK